MESRIPARAPAGALRKLLERGRVVRIPGVYDGITARIAQQAGFEAVVFSGNAVSASLLGVPDLGVLGMSENVDHAANVCANLSIPLLCDADTGYGGVMNVIRTVRAFETAGVQGVHLEDQVTPKRCGLLPQGIPVVDVEEHAMRIRAAVDARSSRDFLIVARTDAASMHGVEQAAARARRYIEAGADATIVMGTDTPEKLRYVADVVRAPLVSVIQEKPPTTELDDALLDSCGVSFALHAGVVRYAVVKAVHEALSALQRDHHTATVRDRMASFEEYNAVLGLEDWLAIEQHYLDAPKG